MATRDGIGSSTSLSAAAGLLPRGRLGLLIPLAEQSAKLSAKWARPGLEVFAEALAPSAGAGEADAAARRLAAQDKPVEGLPASLCQRWRQSAYPLISRHER